MKLNVSTIEKWIKNLNAKAIVDWFNRGTKAEVLLKRILVIGLAVLSVYKAGYNAGTFIAYLGF